jgi:hypothetical protein
MRSDIGKVICERERVHGDGGRSRPRKGYKKDLERVNYRTYHSLADVNAAEYDPYIEGTGYAAPFYLQDDDDWRPELNQQGPSDFDKPAFRKREKITELCGDEKRFTDVLGALAGWVRNQIGRPWAVASSEMDAVLPATGGMSFMHARGHLFDFIRTDVVVGKDGKLYTSDGYYRAFRPLDDYRFGSIAYVDPRDGIVKPIKKTNRKRYGWRHHLKPHHWDGKRAFYAQQAGVWFRFELEPLEPIRTYTVAKKLEHYGANAPTLYTEVTELPPAYDLYFECSVRPQVYYNDRDNRRQVYGGDFYAARKIQLNHREINRLGLNPKPNQLPQPTSNKRKRRRAL